MLPIVLLQEQLRSESLRKDAVTSGAVAVLSVAILLSSGLHARNAALWWCAPAPRSGNLILSWVLSKTDICSDVSLKPAGVAALHT